MATIHMTTEEATRDFAGLLARVRAGERVLIDDASPAVELQVAGNPYLRSLAESLRLARQHGSTATLDGDFERDLEEIVASHPEPLENVWE